MIDSRLEKLYIESALKVGLLMNQWIDDSPDICPFCASELDYGSASVDCENLEAVSPYIILSGEQWQS